MKKEKSAIPVIPYMVFVGFIFFTFMVVRCSVDPCFQLGEQDKLYSPPEATAGLAEACKATRIESDFADDDEADQF